MLRIALIGTLFLMQWGLAVVLKTLLKSPWLGACLCFVPWERLLQFIQSREAQ